MTMIDLFQTRQKSTNNFIIMISILQAWLKTKASVCSKEYASTLCEPICLPDSFADSLGAKKSFYLINFKGCYLNIRSDAQSHSE